jgi:hypothetical protein
MLLVGGAVFVASCGREQANQSRGLSFEELDRQLDTAGLTRGRALLGSFEPYRLPNGLIRVRGAMKLPDGSRLQLTIYNEGGGPMLARVQFPVEDERFHTPPLIGQSGPLPVGPYRLELMTIFDAAWQPPEVMRATADGKRLRGPGMIRARNGEAAFLHVEERRL